MAEEPSLDTFMHYLDDIETPNGNIAYAESVDDSDVASMVTVDEFTGTEIHRDLQGRGTIINDDPLHTDISYEGMPVAHNQSLGNEPLPPQYLGGGNNMQGVPPQHGMQGSGNQHGYQLPNQQLHYVPQAGYQPYVRHPYHRANHRPQTGYQQRVQHANQQSNLGLGGNYQTGYHLTDQYSIDVPQKGSQRQYQKP